MRPAPDCTDQQRWNDYLDLAGTSDTRGDSVCDHRILPLSKYLENIAVPVAQEPSVRYGENELVDWFLGDSAYSVAKTLALHVEQVQRIRAAIMDIDRSEVEAARIELGYTEHDWREKKLAVALIQARAETLRESLEDFPSARRAA